MENLSHTPNQNNKNIPPSILMKLDERPAGDDEFSIDHLKFRAISTGLGFHQEVRGSDLKFKRPLRSSSVMPARQRTMVPPRHAANTATVAMPQIKTSRSVAKVNTPDVAPLLKSQAQVPTTSWQLTAWLIDVVSVMVCFMFTLGVFFVASGLSFAQFLGFMQRQDFQIFAATLLAIYYVIYFSILDLVGSFGKSYLGISVVQTNGQRPRFRHTLLRTLVVMGSWCLLGIPCLFDVQGKLSKTKLLRQE